MQDYYTSRKIRCMHVLYCLTTQMTCRNKLKLLGTCEAGCVTWPDAGFHGLGIHVGRHGALVEGALLRWRRHHQMTSSCCWAPWLG